MNEVVERAAKALHSRDAGWRGQWHEISESLRDQRRFEARVAIEALREPTAAMRSAGKCATIDFSEGAAVNVWRAMLAAALGERADADR